MAPWVLRESNCAFLSCRVANERPAALELGCANELLLPCVTWRLASLSTLVRLALESGEPICCCNCADQRQRGSTSPSKRFKLFRRIPLWSEPLRVIVRSTEIDSTRTSQFRFHPIPAISPTATAQASLLARRCLLHSVLVSSVLVSSVRVLLHPTRPPLRRRQSLARSAPGQGGDRERLQEPVSLFECRTPRSGPFRFRLQPLVRRRTHR
jgi:hypothetical protein